MLDSRGREILFGGGGQARRSKFSFRNNILRLVFFCNGFDNTVIISTLLRGVCDIHSRQYLFRRRVVVVRHGIKYPINPCTQCSVSFWRQGGIHVLKTRVLHRQAVVEYEIRQDRVCVLKSCCVHYFFFFFYLQKYDNKTEIRILNNKFSVRFLIHGCIVGCGVKDFVILNFSYIL